MEDFKEFLTEFKEGVRNRFVHYTINLILSYEDPYNFVKTLCFEQDWISTGVSELTYITDTNNIYKQFSIDIENWINDNYEGKYNSFLKNMLQNKFVFVDSGDTLHYYIVGETFQDIVEYIYDLFIKGS